MDAMLFGIAAARTISLDVDLSPHLARLLFIHEQATEAAVALRQALRSLSDTRRDVALGVSLMGDCRAFEHRTGIRASLVVLGDIADLDEGRKAALLGATREALLNVEKHASASSVVVSLCRTGAGVATVVADDGIGMPKEPDRRYGLGLRAALERLAQVGGRLMLATDEDQGGTTVKAWVPTTSAVPASLLGGPASGCGHIRTRGVSGRGWTTAPRRPMKTRVVPS